MTRTLIPPSSDVHRSIYLLYYEGELKIVTLLPGQFYMNLYQPEYIELGLTGY